MTAAQAAAERWVITTARTLERAAGYGINAGPAARDYDQARAQLNALRGRRDAA